VGGVGRRKDYERMMKSEDDGFNGVEKRSEKIIVGK
jgi:hypothetical protein